MLGCHGFLKIKGRSMAARVAGGVVGFSFLYSAPGWWGGPVPKLKKSKN
jgi:hypothetical protein